MFEFPRFGTGDPRHAVALVRENPFALVVSAVNGPPVATHAPVLVESVADDTLVGGTLLGHMARINPQWRDFVGSPEILLIFSGPHGYVSASVYDADPAVPTWDYAAVHLTGTVELITDPDGTLDVVEQTVATVESTRPQPWQPSARSRERFVSLLSGVTAFRVRVTRQHSLFKLSQDGDDDRRRRVRDEFRTGPYPNPALAELMERVDP